MTMTMTMHMNRVEALLARLNEEQLDGMVVSALQNVRYLSGFPSNEQFVAFLVITHQRRFLITDYRFGELAQEQCKDFEVVVRDRSVQTLGQSIHELAKQCGVKRLGFERDHALYGMQIDLEKDVSGCDLVPTSNLLEKNRRVKDAGEIESIAKAAKIGDRAFERLLGLLKPGMTEKEASMELEYAMAKEGSEGTAFPTILVSGARTSMPHGVPSDKKIAAGDMVTVDFGAIVDGYRSDMTRTFVVGKATSEQRKVYDTIKRAQQVGVDSVRAGIQGKEPYFKVREVLDACEYSKWVGEGLGHCVGLSLHERPFLDGDCLDVLEENFVLTIEPGIYIPNWGGVRIEDDLRVTANGSEVLTHSPRHLIEL